MLGSHKVANVRQKSQNTQNTLLINVTNNKLFVCVCMSEMPVCVKRLGGTYDGKQVPVANRRIAASKSTFTRRHSKLLPVSQRLSTLTACGRERRGERRARQLYAKMIHIR